MSAKLTMTTVQTGNMTTYEDVNNSMVALASAINASETTEKDIARAFEELRTTPNFKAVFHETKFQVVAETFTEGKYSGATAYKYAQVYKLFHNNANVWDNFSIGKMIILSPLMSDKNAKVGITLNGFFASLGMVVINKSINFRLTWELQTSAMHEKISKLRSVGLDDMANDIEKDIPAMPDVEGAEWIENENGGEWVAIPEIAIEIGGSIAIKFKDKQLKDAVSDYIRSIKPSKEKSEKADEKNDDKGVDTEKSLADLKAEALTALMTYTEKLETVPAILKRAIDNLNE